MVSFHAHYIPYLPYISHRILISCHITSYHITSHIIPYHTISYRIVPYRIYYRLFAFNSADVPDAPSSVKVNDIQSRTVAIEWRKPKQDKLEGAIASYLIKYHVVSNPNNVTTVSIAPTPTSYKLSNLVPYTNYSMQIAAISSVGEGVWSELMDFTTDSACKLYL